MRQAQHQSNFNRCQMLLPPQRVQQLVGSQAGSWLEQELVVLIYQTTSQGDISPTLWESSSWLPRGPNTVRFNGHGEILLIPVPSTDPSQDQRQDPSASRPSTRELIVSSGIVFGFSQAIKSTEGSRTHLYVIVDFKWTIKVKEVF